MDIRQAITASLAHAQRVADAYLSDLKPQELLARPVPGANHIAWQLGHLITTERNLVDRAVPGQMPPLPEGFAQRHTRQTAQSDDPQQFDSKEQYLKLAKEVRDATLRIVQSLPDREFDRPVEGFPPFLKTVGDVLLFQGAHWLMHAGQWAVTRRALGRPPLF